MFERRRRHLAAAITAILVGTVSPCQTSAQLFPATIDLADLNGIDGFRLDGSNGAEFSGASVDSAGDINGDGIDDLVIGAQGAYLNGKYSGRAYVVFGRANDGSAPNPAVVNLQTLDGSTGFRLDGEAPDDRAGFAVSRAGDVNGDGIDDLLVSAPLADAGTEDSGKIYVVFGRDGGSGSVFPPEIALGELNGADGFVIKGSDEVSQAQTGFSISQAGDVNGDGLDDILIGANRAGFNSASSGAVYVVFGRDVGAGNSFPSILDLDGLDVSDGFRMDGESAYDSAGSSVSGAGDVNGDGIDDILIGPAPVGFSATRTVYVVFGRDFPAGSTFPAVMNLGSLDGTRGFRVEFDSPEDAVGRSVAAVGDVNGDGVDDLMVGTPLDDVGGIYSGSAYVVFGREVTAGLPFPSVIPVSELDGANGFRAVGVAGDRVGNSIGGAGDVNGDGIADIVIGAPGAKPDGVNSTGGGFVIFGRDSQTSAGFPAELRLDALGIDDGFRINGVTALDQLGSSVAISRDLNGDGVADLILGARRADPNGSDSGSTYVIFGRQPSDEVFADGFE